ncbi:Alpha-L-fucosidase 2 [Senna tora]|uniref:Alpha-L-fucosidase 2 n=1 Tax=Senna tora TaxID=362788 RepID=A0A834W5Y1_9FABA|nr:Alpha-L-fucosidase 2 [Senna tora]
MEIQSKNIMIDSLPLSWRISEATPPQIIAPRRPLPIGIASVQCLAGPEKEKEENHNHESEEDASVRRRGEEVNGFGLKPVRLLMNGRDEEAPHEK